MSLHKVLSFSIIFIIILVFSNAHSTVLPPIMTRHPAPEVSIVTNSSLPEFNVQPPFYRQTEFINKSFTLECEATGQPRYTWTKNYIHFNLTHLYERVKQMPGLGSLIFMAPRDEDIGLYQCFAENDSGTAVSNTALIRKVWIDTAQNSTANATAMQGLPFRLRCHRLLGWPKPQFTWLKNGNPVEDHILTVDAEGDLSIAFIDTDEDLRYDEYDPNIIIFDKYTCVAKTTYISFPVNNVMLIVEENPEFLHRYAWRRVHLSYGVRQFVSREHETAVEGKSTILYCIYGGMPVPEVKWYHNNELVLDEPQHISLKSFGKILQIEKVGPDDRGNYTCKVFDESDIDTQPHRNVFLTVYTIPVLREEPTNLNVTQGRRAVLRCSASSEPAPDISWYFNGRKLSYYRGIPHPRWSVTDQTLTIEELNFTDTGNYGCNATNPVGYAYKDVYVNVVSPPSNLLLPVLITVGLVIAVTSVVIYVCIRKNKKSVYKLPSDNIQLETSTSTPTLAPSDLWNFNRRRLKLLHIIGEGNFGRVYIADVIYGDGKTQHKVAVKTTLINAPDSAHGELLHEIQIMKRIGSYLHVVEMIGSCAEMTPCLLILELLSETLHKYLRRAWRDKYYQIPVGVSNCVSSQMLVGFAYQIARGMKHVSSQGIVHRDLAARNILLSSDLICKVADFGLAREVNDDEVYVRRSNIALPIRWMAPESLLTGNTSVKSDLWSFGIVLWELATLGATPYPGKRAEEVKQMVCGGKHMGMPKTCKPELYEIMSQCWHLEPQHRPDFSTCIETLACLLEKDADYIQLRDFPEEDYFIAEHSDAEIV